MGVLKKLINSMSGYNDEPVQSPSTKPQAYGRKPSLSSSSAAQVSSSSPQIKEPSVPFPQVNEAVSQDNNFQLDDVVDALDEAFEAACSSAPLLDRGTNDSGVTGQDEGEVQELFRQIAATYALPLKNFIFELQCHMATKDAIELCRPVLRSLSGAAETMDLPEIVQRMNEFDTVLSLGQTSSDRFLKDEIREQILANYERLAQVLPEAFRMNGESQRREDVIIQCLLEQIPGMGCVGFDKLYQAGLSSLKVLFLANPEDLAAATGVPARLCASICDTIQRYRTGVENRARHPGQSGYRSRLVELVNELRDGIDIDRDLSEPGSVQDLGSEKRTRRRQRRKCLLEINVTLAELGELDLIHRVEKLSFKRRLQLLEEYLANWKNP
jgi:hypothetical protein